MLDGRFRFDNYVVGAANRLAASAARAVAESPGSVYNPLFIYSSSGLGKTHLLCALGHAARQLHPELVVEYLTLDDVVEQLHLAIASGRADEFKRRYQRVDLLLLDDVQFLTGRAETQSEMLRVFNALQGSGRQIVMTCDRPPSEIADVDERLLTRLSGGLIVDVGMPDYETRVAILRHKCDERQAHFPGERAGGAGAHPDDQRPRAGGRPQPAGRAPVDRHRAPRRRRRPRRRPAIARPDPEPRQRVRRRSSVTSRPPSRSRWSGGASGSASASPGGRGRASTPRCSSGARQRGGARPGGARGSVRGGRRAAARARGRGAAARRPVHGHVGVPRPRAAGRGRGAARARRGR